MIAVSVSGETRSGVLSTVYKRATGVDAGDDGSWVEYAHLVAPHLRQDQDHNEVRIDGHFVMTSRVSYGDGRGTVYVHDLSQVQAWIALAVIKTDNV